jgi:hypothetical protein
MPITEGSTPATAVVTMRASGFMPLQRITADDDERRCAVVDAARVARRHAAVGIGGERRLQRGQFLDRGVGPRMLVGVDDQGIPFLRAMVTGTISS